MLGREIRRKAVAKEEEDREMFIMRGFVICNRS